MAKGPKKAWQWLLYGLASTDSEDLNNEIRDHIHSKGLNPDELGRSIHELLRDHYLRIGHEDSDSHI